MRYALRKQDKIAAAIGDDYLKNHILKSLDSFFRKSNDECIISSVELDTYQTESGESYAVLRVNDLADDNETLTENVQEQEAIALVQELRSRGETLKAIAHRLDTAGYKPKKGGSVWTTNMVYRILMKRAA